MGEGFGDDFESLLDEDLVRLTREGDADAYGVLWSRYYSSGLKYAARITHKDPEDLVVEAYTKILRAIRAGRGPQESFRLYLYQAIRNAAITGGKKTNDVVPGLEEIGSGTESVEGDVLSHIDTERIKRVLLLMKPDQRTILWLSEVEELSTEEIASQMGITKTNVSTSAHRARQEFIRLWTQDHVRLDGVKANSEHAYVLSHAGEYLAGKPSDRVRTRVEAHLAKCTECTDKLAEAKSVAGMFRSRIAPVVAGTAASIVMAGDKAFALPIPTMPKTVKAGFKASPTPAAVGGSVVAALVLGLVGVMLTATPAMPGRLPTAANSPAAAAPITPQEPAKNTPTPTPVPRANPSVQSPSVPPPVVPDQKPAEPAAPAPTKTDRVDVFLLPQIATTVKNKNFTITISKAIPGTPIELVIDNQPPISVIPDKNGQATYETPYVPGADQTIVFRYHPTGQIGPSFTMTTGL